MRNPGRSGPCRRHVPVGDGAHSRSETSRVGPSLGTGTLHQMQPMQFRLQYFAHATIMKNSVAPQRHSNRRQSMLRGYPGHGLRCSSMSRTAPVAGSVWRLPGGEPARSSVKAINMADKSPLIDAKRDIRFLRNIARERSHTRRLRQRSRRAISRTAIQVLRGLCRMRRNTLSETAFAAVLATSVCRITN